MVGARKTRGPVRVTVSEDSEGFWITKGEYGVHAYSHSGAMNVARRKFAEAGGEGKAVIIDLTNPDGGTDGPH